MSRPVLRPPSRRSRTTRAGLLFPVPRVERRLRMLRLADRYSALAATFLTGVLEYLAAESVELAGNACKDHGKKRITPRHIMLAFRNDEELKAFTRGATMPAAGVQPVWLGALFPDIALKNARNDVVTPCARCGTVYRFRSWAKNCAKRMCRPGQTSGHPPDDEC